MDKPDFINDDFSEFEDFLMGEEHGIIRRKKGEVINGAGDVFDRYFYVLEGAVRSFYFHETGNVRTVLTYYGKGALFPLYCPSVSIFEMATSFVADTDTVLLTLAPEVMDRCVNGSASFNRAMYRCYNRMLNQILGELSDRIYLSGMQVLSRFLLRTYEETPGEVLFCTQEDISSHIGVTRSNTARYLKKLREEGALETGRNRIIIKNIEKVREYSEIKDD